MSYARHQTFYLRAGWLAKAVEVLKVTGNSNVFSRKDSTVELGIGRNMVQALRFWVKATGLVDTKRTGEFVLSEFGTTVAKHDPFFELDLTWWLIHVFLVSNSSEASAWHFLFNIYLPHEVQKEHFVHALEAHQRKTEGSPISRSSFYKDYECITATYVGSGCDRGTPEDNIACPLSRLSILDIRRGNIVRKVPPSQDIPLSVIYYVVSTASASRLTVADLMDGEGNLAKTFNLSIDGIYRYLDALSNKGWLEYSRTAGIDTIMLVEAAPWNLIQADYLELGGEMSCL